MPTLHGGEAVWAEAERVFYQELGDYCAGRAELASPGREVDAWRELLHSLA